MTDTDTDTDTGTAGQPPAGAEEQDTAAPASRKRRERRAAEGQPKRVTSAPVRFSAIALAIIAAICAGWFGTSWQHARHSSTLQAARTRDQALQAAEQAAVNMNTLDYRHAKADLNLWLSSSTGTLHSGISSSLTQEMQVVQQKKLITSATVLDGAITSLNVKNGTANVMLAMTFKVQVTGSSPASKFESEMATVRRTASGWRLASLCPTSGCQSGTTG